MDNDKNQYYWASTEDQNELLDFLETRIQSYYTDLEETGLLNVWERAYRAYYGGQTSVSAFNTPLFEGTRLTTGGKQGEKTRVKVNHFRNLLRHIHQLTTSQRPTTQARASNSDYKSQAQTLLANGLVDYYNREKNQERFLIDAAELSLIYGEGFVHAPWNARAGEVVVIDPATQQPIYEGDQEYSIHSPLNVIRDPALANNDHSWHIVKILENKWNLVAKYPAYKEQILEASAFDPTAESNPNFTLRAGNEPINEDLVPFYTFYHDKTEAMPQGRMVFFLENVVLMDGPLPYAKPPVYRVAAQSLVDTIYGYTPAFDLLPIQESIDELHTILMSNNKTFGIPNIWTKDTDKISVTMLQGGMRHMKSEEKPEAVQLTASAPETYNYLGIMEKSGETLAGISATVRGQPEASLKSGAALALVVSQSIQFISSFEESYNRLVEDVSTGLINNLRDFSKTQRVANIVGESSRPFMKEYTSEDLSQINRVVTERVSPLSKTISGRVEIANNLLQQGLIDNPKQYITVLTTGQLDPAIEGAQHKLLNIRAENEELREGRPVSALMIENHPMHIQEHECVLANPEAKRNPQLVQNTLAHIQEHLDLWRSMDPALAALLGIAPPPPPPMMGAPAPQQPQGSAQVMNSTPPVMEQVDDVQMAQMPSLPEGAPPQAQEAYDQVPEVVPQ
jgi:hypothetical protein